MKLRVLVDHVISFSALCSFSRKRRMFMHMIWLDTVWVIGVRVIIFVSITRKNSCLRLVTVLRLLLYGGWKSGNQVLILIFIIGGLICCLVTVNLQLVYVFVWCGVSGLYIVFEFFGFSVSTPCAWGNWVINTWVHFSCSKKKMLVYKL